MSSELDLQLSGLEALAKANGRPSRHDARPLLLELGRELESGPGGAAETAKRRLEALGGPFEEAWVAAVADELAMAATEHVRSADPRYLDHPKYDWRYTLEARELLARRLRAVLFLGIPVDPGLTASIERADRLIEARKPGLDTNR